MADHRIDPTEEIPEADLLSAPTDLVDEADQLEQQAGVPDEAEDDYPHQ